MSTERVRNTSTESQALLNVYWICHWHTHWKSGSTECLLNVSLTHPPRVRLYWMSTERVTDTSTERQALLNVTDMHRKSGSTECLLNASLTHPPKGRLYWMSTERVKDTFTESQAPLNVCWFCHWHTNRKSGSETGNTSGICPIVAFRFGICFSNNECVRLH